MKFEIKTVRGLLVLSDADFAVLKAEDDFARPDGQSLSYLLEDLPEVQSVGYYVLSKSPHIEITLNALPGGGAPDFTTILMPVVREHILACYEAAKR